MTWPPLIGRNRLEIKGHYNSRPRGDNCCLYFSITNVVHRLAKKLRAGNAAVRGFPPDKLRPAITTPAIYARLKDRPAFQSKGVGTLHRVGDCGCFKFHDDALPGLALGTDLPPPSNTKETQSPARQPRSRIRFLESVRVFYRGFSLIRDMTLMQGRKGCIRHTWLVSWR
jgi:hypothetical protein